MAASKPAPALEDIAARTLTGDLRDFLMQWGKNLQKPWPQMSEREQEMFRDACGRQAETVVRKVTNLVGAQDHLAFEITTRDFNRKGDRLEAKITTPYSLSNLEALAKASDAGPIVIAVVSLDDYRGERAPAHIMPDQPDLMDDIAEGDGGTEFEARSEEGAQPSSPAGTVGDGLAEASQNEALSAAGEGASSTGDQALGPEATGNVEALQGIKPLADGEADPLDATPSDGPKKRKRRTAEERTAANAAAAEGSASDHPPAN